MKLTYVCLATVVVTMCNTSTAVNGALHGLRSFASLYQQKEKNLASLELQGNYSKERHILSQASQHDILINEEEAVARQRRKIKKKKKTTRKKNRKPWQDDKDRGKKKRKKGRKSKSQSRKACSNQDRIVCDGKGKKVLICLHKHGGIVKTVCMKGKKVPYHLRSHPDDYCGRCTDDDLDLPIPSSSSNTEMSTTTSSSPLSYIESKSKKSKVTAATSATSKSSSGEKSKSSKAKVQDCYSGERSDEERVLCGRRGKRLLVCRQDKYGDSRTVCMKEKRIPDHLRRHPDDYCGECTSDESTTTSSTSSTTSSLLSSPTTTTNGPMLDCNDNNKCTEDSYDVSEEKCVYTPILCSEGNVCYPTDGSCLPVPQGSCGGGDSVDLVYLSTDCDSSDAITVALPNGVVKVFDKSVTTGNFRGEDSDGSTFEYTRDQDGNIFGGLEDSTDGTVIQYYIDSSGEPAVKVRHSSDFHIKVDDAVEVETESEEVVEALNVITPESTNNRKLQENVQIDLMAVWTPHAECVASGQPLVGCVRNDETMANMIQQLEGAVVVANDAYRNSGIQVELVLVHSQMVQYTETTFSKALDELKSTNDNVLDDVHDLRILHGADLVTMVIAEVVGQERGMLGWGTRPPLFELSSSEGAPQHMFTTVRADQLLAPSIVLVHEIGHNFGCKHDRVTQKNECTNKGVNYGYRTETFRTIMSYECRPIVGEDPATGNPIHAPVGCDGIQSTDCPTIRFFSTPDPAITWNGNPVGDSRHNNAKIINDVSANVASYFTNIPGSECNEEYNPLFRANRKYNIFNGHLPDLCETLPSLGDNSGCPFLYDNKRGFPETQYQYNGVLLEQEVVPEGTAEVLYLLDIYCQCRKEEDAGCSTRIPLATEYDPLDDLTQEYCQFAGIWDGNVPFEVMSELSNDVVNCGCYWIKEAKEWVGECPNVNLEEATELFSSRLPVDYTTSIEGFGSAVAQFENTALIGAPSKSTKRKSSVYSYNINEEGITYEFQQELNPEPESSIIYGNSVALFNNIALVSKGESVYVFIFDGTDWIEEDGLRTVDPDITGFGRSVALHGDMALIGADGAAYVFVRTISDEIITWREIRPRLVPNDPDDDFGSVVALSDTTALISNSESSIWFFTCEENVCGGPTFEVTKENEGFGTSLSLHHDTALVGARTGLNDNEVRTGSAYIYTPTTEGDMWVETTKLLPAYEYGSIYAQNFGSSVSLSEDKALVGASTSYIHAKHSGSAFIFKRSESWKDTAYQTKIIPYDGGFNYLFGESVSLSESGDVALIGAPGSNSKQTSSAYTFDVSECCPNPGPLDWGNEKKVVPGRVLAGDKCGQSVAISHDYIAMGAPYSSLSVGAVYTYLINTDGIDLSSRQRFQPNGNGDRFGWSLGITGGTLVVGEPYYANEIGQVGAVHIYKNVEGEWATSSPITLTADDAKPGDAKLGDKFGYSVSISGDTIVIGAPDSDIGVGTDGHSIGSVYIFEEEGDEWVWKKTLRPESCKFECYQKFGHSVSIVADLIVVGAPFYDTDSIENCGAVYIYKKKGEDWILMNNNLPLLANDASRDDRFGWSVEVNLKSTVVVGAQNVDEEYYNVPDVGAAYIFEHTVDESGADAWELTKKIVPDDGDNHVGYSVGIYGDTVILGTYRFGITDEKGVAYVYKRENGVWAKHQKLVASDGEGSDDFGYSVGVFENNIIVGARGDDADKGSVYVYQRGTIEPSTSPTPPRRGIPSIPPTDMPTPQPTKIPTQSSTGEYCEEDYDCTSDSCGRTGKVDSDGFEKKCCETESTISLGLNKYCIQSEDDPIQLAGYIFWPFFDSEGGDIPDIGQLNEPRVGLARVCNSDPTCKGFNTEGWIKQEIKPLDQWTSLSVSPDRKGLYIKTPHTFMVNGVELSDEESKWMKWIAKWTVPNVKLARDTALINIARAAWWSLKEGILDIANWSDPQVPDPFRYNLCQFEDGTTKQMDVEFDKGALKVCDSNDWKVGISSKQVTPEDIDLTVLQEDAIKFYGSVDLALSRSAKQAQYNEGEIYDGILASEGRLQEAWLLRSHLIGMSIVGTKIEENCLDSETAEPWCVGGSFVPDASSIPGSIDDVVILLQSLIGGDCMELDDYVMWQSVDETEEGNWLEQLRIREDYESFAELAWICDSNPECIGFNTEGWLKSSIRPQDEWLERTLPGQCEGSLYVKNWGPSEKDTPWVRNTDWSNMEGECTVDAGGSATRIDDDTGVLEILNGLMNTQTPSEGLLFRTPDYLNDDWVPGSHVNNLIRSSNPAYSLTYLPSSPVIDCKLINGKDFVDWCQSDGLRPPSGSCGGPGFCAEDFIGCPLGDTLICGTDNNGEPLPNCDGKDDRWNNAIVTGVYGRKYEANANTDLKLPDGSSFYSNPTVPVRTNVCYPTDANAVDLRVDGNGQLGSVNGDGGCRSVNGAKQDFVCDGGTCLSYESFNCRCDYNGKFGGNGVSGVTGAQAGQQIVNYNDGVCGNPGLQPSDYADAAACWYDTSEVEAMNNLIAHSNSMWLRRDDWLNWEYPAKLPDGGIGELSYHGWNECTVRIPDDAIPNPNPSIREFKNMDALTIILPALTDPGDDRWSLCDLSFDALDRLSDTLNALWYRGYNENPVPVVVMQQVQGRATDPNNDQFCKNYWDSTDCTNGYRKTFFKQTIRFPTGDSCLLMESDGEVYYFKDDVGLGTPCADNPVWQPSTE